MNDAALQLPPLQEDMPFVVASQISPSGMTLAGKYGIGSSRSARCRRRA
jgi:limonene 1,2-monooxygenase